MVPGTSCLPFPLPRTEPEQWDLAGDTEATSILLLVSEGMHHYFFG